MRRLLCSVAFALLATPAIAQEHVQTFVYVVHHQLFGDIGTLTREIRDGGERVAIATRADIRVEMFGVSMHTMQLAWNEEWLDGHLQDFRGRTVRNREINSVHAWSEGDGYVVEGKAGHTLAPVGLQPINPWSVHFADASMVMSPESGKLYAASIEDAGIQMLNAGGRAHRVRHYVLHAGSTNHLYFDESGTLIATEFADITGNVTVSLKQAASEVAAAR
jgi:hypothetical protein